MGSVRDMTNLQGALASLDLSKYLAKMEEELSDTLSDYVYPATHYPHSEELRADLKNKIGMNEYEIDKFMKFLCEWTPRLPDVSPAALWPGTSMRL